VDGQLRMERGARSENGCVVGLRGYPAARIWLGSSWSMAATAAVSRAAAGCS